MRKPKKHLFLLAAVCMTLFAGILLLQTSAEEAPLFLSDHFLASDGERLPIEPSGVTLSVSDDEGFSFFLKADADMPRESNALRFFMTNHTNASYMTVNLTYLSDRGMAAKSYRVELTPFGEACTYVLRSPYVATLQSVTMTFPADAKGEVIVHALQAVNVYEDETASYGTVISCLYRAENRTVTLKGTVYHDVTIRASGGTIGLFRLAIGQSVEDILNDPNILPVASSAISIGFELQVPATDVLSRFAAYAAVICMPDGTRLPVAGEQYAHSPEKNESDADRADDRSFFKGLDTSLTASAVDVNVGSAVVNVYLNRLENTAHKGHLYTIEDKYFYFDRAYVASLDNEIRAFSSSECKVYLRLLAEDDGSDLPCADTSVRPNRDGLLPIHADDEEALIYLYACVSFLCNRYTGEESGQIEGLILDSCVNVSRTATDLDSVVRSYGHTLAVVAETARALRPSLRIIVPVSDDWNLSTREGSVSASLFLESLCRYMNDRGLLSVDVMVESRYNPFGLSDASLTIQEALANAEKSIYRLSSENIDLLDVFLVHYGEMYTTLTGQYLYFWIPDQDTLGDTLSASFVYQYYRLYSDPAALAFFTSFRDAEIKEGSSAFFKVKYLIKYIDTNQGQTRTAPYLDLFGVSDWSQLIPNFDPAAVISMTLSEAMFLRGEAMELTGRYVLFDFSTANSPRGWYAGSHCQSLSMGVSNQYGKTLDALMQSDLSEGGEYADISYVFDYAESLEDTPFVTLRLAIDSPDHPDAVYEVKLVLGSPRGCVEARQTVQDGEMTTLTLGMMSGIHIKEITYMRLCVKCVMGETDEFTLHLKSVSLDSRVYDSQTLSELFSARHEALLGKNESEEKRKTPHYLLVGLLTFGTLALTAFVMVSLNRRRKEELKKQ